MPQQRSQGFPISPHPNIPKTPPRLLSAPLLKFNFQWFNGKPISWQTVKVLTSKQTSQKTHSVHICMRTTCNITFKKGSHVFASSSKALPRFMALAAALQRHLCPAVPREGDPDSPAAKWGAVFEVGPARESGFPLASL